MDNSRLPFLVSTGWQVAEGPVEIFSSDERTYTHTRTHGTKYLFGCMGVGCCGGRGRRWRRNRNRLLYDRHPVQQVGPKPRHVQPVRSQRVVISNNIFGYGVGRYINRKIQRFYEKYGEIRNKHRISYSDQNENLSDKIDFGVRRYIIRRLSRSK